MSSHREAPAISQDPGGRQHRTHPPFLRPPTPLHRASHTPHPATYAFLSPDDPSTVTIITNYVPLEGPPGGPNFFEFGDDVLYSIYIDNDGDALPEITYQFSFHTTYENKDTF